MQNWYASHYRKLTCIVGVRVNVTGLLKLNLLLHCLFFDGHGAKKVISLVISEPSKRKINPSRFRFLFIWFHEARGHPKLTTHSLNSVIAIYRSVIRIYRHMRRHIWSVVGVLRHILPEAQLNLRRCRCRKLHWFFLASCENRFQENSENKSFKCWLVKTGSLNMCMKISKWILAFNILSFVSISFFFFINVAIYIHCTYYIVLNFEVCPYR